MIGRLTMVPLPSWNFQKLDRVAWAWAPGTLTGATDPNPPLPLESPAAGRLHRSAPLDGLGGAGQRRFVPSLS